MMLRFSRFTPRLPLLDYVVGVALVATLGRCVGHSFCLLSFEDTYCLPVLWLIP